MFQTRLIHRCIPYCRPDHGEHTQLVYTDDSETSETLRRTIGGGWGLTVLRAAIEHDAPPQVDTSGTKPFAKAWLVTWQCEDDGAGLRSDEIGCSVFQFNPAAIIELDIRRAGELGCGPIGR